ncbi:MAG: helix-turn-helix domain-containing protein [Anaerolineales bacterium]|nr:helix-turn-helix domain-containing protein [Anaerolineales bacterium]
MNDLLPDTEQWVSLAKAAKMLGIHSTTLRRWADNGQIPFMLTPGGHRRFALADLQNFADTHRQSYMPTSIEQQWAERALVQTRQEISANQSKAWMAHYDDDTREQHRILGRRLMGLTLQYISDVNGNGTLLAEASTLGEEYGRLCITNNLPLTDALQATIFFRDMLVETAFHLPNTASIKPEANLRLMRRINELLNAVHLAIAAAYERGI